MKNPRLIWVGFGGLVLLFIGYFWFSPFLDMNGIRGAILSNNSSALERYIDFPRVREGLKGELNRALMKETHKDTSGFGALGLALAGPIIDRLVDAYISPEGLASVGTNQEPQSGDAQSVRDWQIRREGISRALISNKDNPDVGLVMERSGLSWRVVRLQLNLEQTMNKENS